MMLTYTELRGALLVKVSFFVGSILVSFEQCHADKKGVSD
jgi:hypothetical protein